MKAHSLTIGIIATLLSGVASAQESTPTQTAESEVTAAAPSAQTSPPADAPQSPPTLAETGRHGLVLALRPLAAGFAMGDLAEHSKLRDLTVAQIPIWLDVGYMVLPQLMVGIYAQYAFASGGHQFTGSGSDIRLGVEAQYHPTEAGLLNPWIGLGTGYEILDTSAAFGNASVSAKGFEFANLQAGLDFRLGRAWGLGLFASYSLGQYSSISMNGSSSGEIGAKALHEWLVVGLQASLSL